MGVIFERLRCTNDSTDGISWTSPASSTKRSIDFNCTTCPYNLARAAASLVSFIWVATWSPPGLPMMMADELSVATIESSATPIEHSGNESSPLNGGAQNDPKTASTSEPVNGMNVRSSVGSGCFFKTSNLHLLVWGGPKYNRRVSCTWVRPCAMPRLVYQASGAISFSVADSAGCGSPD